MRQHVVALRSLRRLLPQRVADMQVLAGVSPQESQELESKGRDGRLREEHGVGLPERDRRVHHAQQRKDTAHVDVDGGQEHEPGGVRGFVPEELLLQSLCQCQHQWK